MTKGERDLLIEATSAISVFLNTFKHFLPEVKIPRPLEEHTLDAESVTKAVSIAIHFGKEHDSNFAKPHLEGLFTRLMDTFQI